MKTISILGCGWLGLPLGSQLAQSGYLVKGSTKTVDKLPLIRAAGMRAHFIDIATRSPNTKDFLDADTLIVAITLKDIPAFERLIRYIEQSQVSKVLFISSTSVYPFTGKVMNEDSKTQPTVLRQIEDLFINNTLFETTILRFAGLVGDRRHPGLFFRNGKTCKNPDGHVNMIHQDDCIGLIKEIISKQLWGEVFNGCADTHPIKKVFYDHYARLASKPSPEYEVIEPVASKIISNEKIKKATGYKFKYPDVMRLPEMEFQV